MTAPRRSGRRRVRWHEHEVGAAERLQDTFGVRCRGPANGSAPAPSPGELPSNLNLGRRRVGGQRLFVRAGDDELTDPNPERTMRLTALLPAPTPIT